MFGVHALMNRAAKQIAGLVCVFLFFVLCGRAGTNTLSIALDTNAWSIGAVPLGGLADTWLRNPGNFTVSNSGDVAATLYISVSNSTPGGWLPGETPGWDQFRMRWSLENGRALPFYRCVSGSPSVMTQGFDTNQVFKFDMEFAAPTGSLQVGVQQQIQLNIMAVTE